MTVRAKDEVRHLEASEGWQVICRAIGRTGVHN